MVGKSRKRICGRINKLKINTYEFTWGNGKATTKGKTVIEAVKKIKFKSKNIEVGFLIQVRENGIKSWWDGRQFTKYAKLQNSKSVVRKL